MVGWVGDVVQVVECLPTRYKGLTSTPLPPKRKKVNCYDISNSSYKSLLKVKYMSDGKRMHRMFH
jgi:hypothetical protein